MAAPPVCLLAIGYPCIQPLLSFRISLDKGRHLRSQLAPTKTIIFNDNVLNPLNIRREMPFPTTFNIQPEIGHIKIPQNVVSIHAYCVAQRMDIRHFGYPSRAESTFVLRNDGSSNIAHRRHRCGGEAIATLLTVALPALSYSDWTGCADDIVTILFESKGIQFRFPDDL